MERVGSESKIHPKIGFFWCEACPRQRTIYLLALGASSFRSLQRVYLLLLRLSLDFDMSGKIAVARSPLGGRVGIRATELTRRQFHNPLTSFALFHDRITGSPIEPAAGFRHEGAFRSCLHSLTNHDTYLQNLVYCDRPSGESVANNNRVFRLVKIFRSIFLNARYYTFIIFSGTWTVEEWNWNVPGCIVDSRSLGSMVGRFPDETTG